MWVQENQPRTWVEPRERRLTQTQTSRPIIWARGFLYLSESADGKIDNPRNRRIAKTVPPLVSVPARPARVTILVPPGRPLSPIVHGIVVDGKPPPARRAADRARLCHPLDVVAAGRRCARRRQGAARVAGDALALRSRVARAARLCHRRRLFAHRSDLAKRRHFTEWPGRDRTIYPAPGPPVGAATSPVAARRGARDAPLGRGRRRIGPAQSHCRAVRRRWVEKSAIRIVDLVC